MVEMVLELLLIVQEVVEEEVEDLEVDSIVCIMGRLQVPRLLTWQEEVVVVVEHRKIMIQATLGRLVVVGLVVRVSSILETMELLVILVLLEVLVVLVELEVMRSSKTQFILNLYRYDSLPCTKHSSTKNRVGATASTCHSSIWGQPTNLFSIWPQRS
jgi:hypothetical protein